MKKKLRKYLQSVDDADYMDYCQRLNTVNPVIGANPLLEATPKLATSIFVHIFKL